MNALVSQGGAFTYQLLSPDESSVARDAAARIQPLMRRSATDLVTIGTELKRVKQALPHGQFSSWLKAELTMSIQTAERFMAVSERLGHKINSLTNLGPDALYTLAAQSTPESVVDDVALGKIDPSPKSIRAEISRLRGTRSSTEGPSRDPWRALDALCERYGHLKEQSLTAELMVRLAYAYDPPDPKYIQQQVQRYQPDLRDDVQKSVIALAGAISKWAAGKE